jgi:hypothetical protein
MSITGLWLPERARPDYKCPVQGCSKRFYKGEERALDAHIRRCAGEHHEQLVNSKPFDPLEATDDHEYLRWVKKHGRVR